MSIIKTVPGDVFQTDLQAIAIGLNANGRLGTSPLYTVLHDRYPVFVSAYHKRTRAEALALGTVWIWQDSHPWIVGLIVRETPQGATRLRYVETAMLNLVKDWERLGLRSLAVAPLANTDEWSAARQIVEHYGAQMALPIVIYSAYVPGIAGDNAQNKP